MKVGLLIDPYADIDNLTHDASDGMTQDHIRSAVSKAEEMTIETLNAAGSLSSFDLVTAGGALGENVLLHLKSLPLVVYRPDRTISRNDIKRSCTALIAEDIEVLVFAGGDDTAHDIMDVVHESIPVIGIPTGRGSNHRCSR